MLRFLLYPLELLYRLGKILAFHFKKYFGGKGPYPFKIISVGNLTVGGTGKSVVVPFIIQRLAGSSAIVMRGYKGHIIRDGNSHLVTDGKHILLSACESGDEAMMYAQQEKVPVVVGKNRARSCDLLAFLIRKKGLNIKYVLLDDAYQNHAVKKDFEILVIDARKPFDNGHCLPAGYLREKDYTRADVIFLTHADAVSEQTRKEISQKLLCKFPQDRIFFGKHAPAGVYFHNKIFLKPDSNLSTGSGRAGFNCARGELVEPFERINGSSYNNQSISNASCRQIKFLLVTGVGSRGGVLKTAQQAGLHIVKTVEFKDHHAYTLQELDNLIESMNHVGADAILTTSKDWVKISALCSKKPALNHMPFYVLRVSFEFLYQDEYARFDQLLTHSTRFARSG